VHLRDRGGADRRLLDAREQRFERAAEAAFDLLADQRERERGQRILQPQQVERRFLTHEIGARRQRLAELDRGRADRLERVGVARRLRHAQRAVPCENPAPFEEPPQVDGRVGQIFQPLWIATSPPRSGSTRVRAKPASAIIRSKRAMSGKRRIDSTR
jgi:hypothetical protein